MLSITVDTLVDEDDGEINSGVGTSLREAIFAALPNEEINFAPSLAGGTITLTEGELSIDSSVEIVGLGAENLTIVADDNSRVFNITNSSSSTEVDVAISGLTITGGHANDKGGGIYNLENLTLDSVVVVGNHAETTGGGLYSRYGTLSIHDSTFQENTSADGGGVRAYLGDDADLEIVGSTFDSNTATGSGGGILIQQLGTALIHNSTFSGNVADNSGAIRISGATGATIEILNSTITDNRGIDQAGGIASWSTEAIIHNSIVAGNFSGDPTRVDAAGTFHETSSHNLIGSTSSSDLNDSGDGNIPVVGDLLLGPLADNGGSTKTHALLPGSQAIDRADDSRFADSSSYAYADQRGAKRNQDSLGLLNDIDIGAFELQQEVVATADFNGDGRPDKLFQDVLAGNLSVLLDLGGRIETSGWASLDSPGKNWREIETGDFNGDGRDDVWVFYSSPTNPSGAYWTLLLSDGNTFVSSDTNIVENWQISTVGDFDGDGTDELIGRESINHDWKVLRYDKVAGASVEEWGKHFHGFSDWTLFVGDVDRDGRDDLIGRRTVTANADWYVALSVPNAGVSGSFASAQNYGKWFDPFFSGSLDHEFHRDFEHDIASVDARGSLQKVIDEFSWVYNNVELELYPGLMKGITATEQTQAGNPWDQAALLVDKLETAGFEADIASGRVRVPEDEFAKWLGVDNANAAFKVVESTLDGNATKPLTGIIEFAHAWVRVEVPTANGLEFVDLDPSWKFQERLEGVAVNLDPNSTGNGTFDEFEYLKLSADNKQLPVEFYEDQVQQYLAASATAQGKSLADVSREGAIITRVFDTIPAGLGTGVTIVDVNSNGTLDDDVETHPNFDAIKDDPELTHRVEVSFARERNVSGRTLSLAIPGDVGDDLSTPENAPGNKSITLSSSPSTYTINDGGPSDSGNTSVDGNGIRRISGTKHFSISSFGNYAITPNTRLLVVFDSNAAGHQLVAGWDTNSQFTNSSGETVSSVLTNGGSQVISGLLHF